MSKPRMTPPASNQSSASAAQESIESPESLHQAFTWLPSTHKNDATAQFFEMTKDVCQGVETCIDLVHFSTMDRDSDTTPVLNIADTERLLRLALTSSKMLGQMAACNIDLLGVTSSKRAG